MIGSILESDLIEILEKKQAEAQQPVMKTVMVDGKPRVIPSPFPSPADWRDCWIYFLLTDRFNNPQKPPTNWNKKFGLHQGGTFKGVQQKLGYLEHLGVRALWLSPVLKNPTLETQGFGFSYSGYNTQDFLNLDARFATDGTLETAEQELKELVDEAHGRGIYVILDIVLNHAAHVFDYEYNGQLTDTFKDPAVMNAPLGQEPHIEWIDSHGKARPDWQDKIEPPTLSHDDAVWPKDLQQDVFFRRRGDHLSDQPGPHGFVTGDFGLLRQMVVEYDASDQGQNELAKNFGPKPVLSILIRAYEHLMAKYDIDGFRIDTVKYVHPDAIKAFGNAIREYALSIGKANFFTFAEVWDDERVIDSFVGRTRGGGEGLGIDAALDFPLSARLPDAIKGLGEYRAVEAVQEMFVNRKKAQENLISSHGEAGQYFVAFFENHDHNERFNTPGTPPEQVTMAMALLFSLQGIPCFYYGSEQGLNGTVDGLDSKESVREALWGKPNAFDETNPFYQALKAIAECRKREPALRYGRVYFRQVSGNGQDFGFSKGVGGVLAFSRILTDHEVVIVANTSTTTPFNGRVLVDYDLNRRPRTMVVAYSNKGSAAVRHPVTLVNANIFEPERETIHCEIAAMDILLEPMEVEIFTVG